MPQNNRSHISSLCKDLASHHITKLSLGSRGGACTFNILPLEHFEHLQSLSISMHRKHFLYYCHSKIVPLLQRSTTLESLELDNGLYLQCAAEIPSLNDAFGPLLKSPVGTKAQLKHFTWGKRLRFSTEDVPVFLVLGANLTSLSVTSDFFALDNGFIDWSLFWNTLRDMGVKLKKLKASHICLELIQYLVGYSDTLETLCFLQQPMAYQFGAISNTQASKEMSKSETLAQLFWTTALPRHASSLRVLDVYATISADWCYSKSAARGLAACTRLRSLTISLCGLSALDMEEILAGRQQTVILTEVPENYGPETAILSTVRTHTLKIRHAFIFRTYARGMFGSVVHGPKSMDGVLSFRPTDAHPQRVLVEKHRGCSEAVKCKDEATGDWSYKLVEEVGQKGLRFKEWTEQEGCS